MTLDLNQGFVDVKGLLSSREFISVLGFIFLLLAAGIYKYHRDLQRTSTLQLDSPFERFPKEISGTELRTLSLHDSE